VSAEEMSEKWFVDQSRYMAGWECMWRRLIRYHWLQTGLVSKETPADIQIGVEVHALLDAAYGQYMETKKLLSLAEVEELIRFGEHVEGHPFAPISKAFAHAYIRAVLPWVVEHYEVLAVEEEFTHDLGDEIVWMGRPDLVLHSKEDGKSWGVDFKTTGSKPDRIAAIHSVSLQTIMNGYSISTKHGELGGYQIHVLNRGSVDYPSFLTHAYYRAGQLGSPDDWQPKSRRKDGSWLGKLYRKVEVSKYRPIPEWVWSMPIDQLQEAVPILEMPYGDQAEQLLRGRKILQAINSILDNEKLWREKLQTIDWQTVSTEELDRLFPRTFRCVQYGRECEYHSVCFENPHPPRELTEHYPLEPRTPHHPQEGSLDD
jgi:hypothetical protein